MIVKRLIYFTIGFQQFVDLKFQKMKNIYYKERILSNAKKCGENLFVGGKSHVNKNTFLGNNISFNGMSIKGNGKVIIGDNFHSGTDCQMITQIHNYDYGEKIPYDNTYILKEIIIEDNVWFGNNIIILGGVTIGEGAIIQAGSVVVKNIPKYAIVGGNPAKQFKTRNIEHYLELKKKKSFC
jgi:acetyltransferase-like isoleucine patch superfamily enzyme